MGDVTDPTDPTPPTRSVALATALAAQDVAAVAYALRNDVVIVPQLVVNGQGEQVRVFGREGTDKRMLLLFSSAENYVRLRSSQIVDAYRGQVGSAGFVRAEGSGSGVKS